MRVLLWKIFINGALLSDAFQKSLRFPRLWRCRGEFAQSTRRTECSAICWRATNTSSISSCSILQSNAGLVATGSHDGRIRVWATNGPTVTLASDVAVHEGTVFTIETHGAGLLVTGGFDRFASIHDLQVNDSAVKLTTLVRAGGHSGCVLIKKFEARPLRSTSK